MLELPSKDDFDTTDDWLSAIEQETTADYETLEHVVNELSPELLSLSDPEKTTQLKQLMEKHVTEMVESAGHGSSWIDFYFEYEGEVSNHYQHSRLAHNIPQPSDDQIREAESLAVEYDMEIAALESDMATLLDATEGGDNPVERIALVLDRMFGVGIDDLEHVEEVSDGETTSWTDV